MPDVYVAIGGNVEPEKYLDRALSLLQARFGALTVSPAYRNAAVGFEGPDFINLVVKFVSGLPLPQIRGALQQIEAACDRPSDAPKWAPRTMDIDVLLYGDLVSDAPGLIVPRPDLVRRAYMLKPMAEIAPDVVHPMLDKTMQELWRDAGLDDHAMEQVTIPRSGRRPPPGSAR
jgi:2-amino-4-hydroxy-6-hydroxymethyldihydropteridine diphosphokinase